jgi:outer membrane protein
MREIAVLLVVPLLGLAITLSPAFSQEGDSIKVLSLQEAQTIAVSNHPNVARARFDVAARAEAVRIATAPLLPQVGLNLVSTTAAPNSRIAAPGGINDPTVIGRTSLGIGLSQLVTDFGRTSDLRRAATSDLQAIESAQELTGAQVLLDTTLSYFEALRAQALVRVAKQMLAQTELLETQTVALEKANLRSSLDLSIARQNVAEAKQFLLQATSGRANAFSDLSTSMGFRELHNFILQEPQEVRPTSFDQNEIEDLAVSHSPGLRALERSYDAGRYRAKAAEEAFNPVIQLQGFVGTTPQHASDQKIASNYAVGGLTVSVPLFSGDLLSANASKAKFEAASIAAQIDEQRNRLLRETRLAKNGMDAAYTNIELSRIAFETSEKAYALISARYNLGSNSIIDLSGAQLRLTEASIRRADSTYEFLKRKAALEFLTGELVAK